MAKARYSRRPSTRRTARSTGGRSGSGRRTTSRRSTRRGSGGRRTGGGVIRIEIVNPTPTNLVPMQEAAPKRKAKF